MARVDGGWARWRMGLAGPLPHHRAIQHPGGRALFRGRDGVAELIAVLSQHRIPGPGIGSVAGRDERRGMLRVVDPA